MARVVDRTHKYDHTQGTIDFFLTDESICQGASQQVYLRNGTNLNDICV